MKKAIFLALMPGAALAHTGHEAAVVHGDAHWVIQGDHLLVVAALGAVASVVVGYAVEALKKRLARA
jgi:hydrogenase/urease accessory protein HupE